MSNVIHLLTRQPVDPQRDWKPAPRECLPCFVRRMVEARGCTGTLVWAEHWKRLRSPGATALIARLERQGALCDCALISIPWTLSPDLSEWTADGALAEPATPPDCPGVRPRSTRPCELWSSRASLAR
jgi:hypothetical protein